MAESKLPRLQMMPHSNSSSSLNSLNSFRSTSPLVLDGEFEFVPKAEPPYKAQKPQIWFDPDFDILNEVSVSPEEVKWKILEGDEINQQWAAELLNERLLLGRHAIDYLLKRHEQLPADETFALQLARDLLNDLSLKSSENGEWLDNVERGAYDQLRQLYLDYLGKRRKELWESMILMGTK